MKYNCQSNKFEDGDYSNYKFIDVLSNKNNQLFLKLRNIVNRDEYIFCEVINFKNYWYKKDDNGEYKTLFGEKCSKTFNNENANFEKDIKNDYRFLIDYCDNFFKPLEEKDVACIMYDIETNKSLDIKNTEGEIISIAFHSSLDNKNYAYYLINDKDLTNCKTFLDRNICVEGFKNEKIMLEMFLLQLKKYDLICGFNNNFYDDIYLINRAKKLKIKAFFGYFKDTFINEKIYENRFEQALMDKGSPVYSELNFIDVKPIVSKLFQRGNFINKPSRYSLEEIGKILNLEQQKIKLKDGPATLWKEDRIEELIEYNVQDVVATLEIAKRMKIIDMILTRKNLFRVNFNQLFKNSRIIDYLMLSRYKDIVFPTVDYDTPSSSKFEGAYVMETKGGVYNNVGVLDVNAMYPSIIIGMNISPETLIDKDKHVFSKDKVGLMSDIVKFTLMQRYEYKKLAQEALDKGDNLTYDIYKMTEHQIKDLINSIYGVFAYKFFRLYNIDIAGSITYFGREILKNVIDYVNSFEDFEVLYGDTDSFFAHYKKSTANNVELFEDLETKVNEFLKLTWTSKMIDSQIKMECETIFNTLILPKAKKSYIGLTSLLKGAKKNNELYAKGFSLIRKDTPAGLKSLLQHFYNEFLINVSINNMLKIKNDLKQLKRDLKILDYTKFLIVKQMNNEPEDYKTIPQHVRAMLYSNKNLGTNFSRANYKGGCIFVVVNSKYPQTEIITLDDDTPLPQEMTVNYDKYFDLFVKSKICLLSESFEKLFNENKSILEYM